MKTSQIPVTSQESKRRFLVRLTAAIGAAGALCASVPFLGYLFPSARAKAAGAPVEVDISGLAPGGRTTVNWRGKPVWVVRRPAEKLARLAELTDKLRDPHSATDQQPTYAENPHRSIKPEVLVVVGICTHLGCSPLYRPETAPTDLGPDWIGGFFCPCHGSRFDLAGRVYKGVPAPTNLVVPPHRYLSDSRILVGEDADVPA